MRMTPSELNVNTKNKVIDDVSTRNPIILSFMIYFLFSCQWIHGPTISNDPVTITVL